jgi:glycosyltransferase involved in cell wall biosynthesis
VVPEPVRVLHLIDGLAGGGSERWVYDIARLSEPGRVQHRVVAVHPDRGRFVFANRLTDLGAYGTRSRDHEATTTRKEHSQRRRGKGAPLRLLRRSWMVGVILPGGAFRTIREWIGFRPHVIHGHTFHGFVFALRLSQVSGRPLVHTVPSLFSQMEDAGYGWLPSLYVRYHSRVDRFFTAYPHELRAIGVPSRRVHEIRGVVDLDLSEAARVERLHHRQTVRGALRMPPTSPIVLSVGRLHRSKGIESAAEAVAAAMPHVPNLHWVVLGDGDERERLEARIAQLGITERSHLLGYVADVLPYYAASDAYLRTTLLEAENQSSYQAMAMGLPVVGFATGASTELVVHVGHGALVEKGDSASMGRELVRIMTSPDCGAVLGERGRMYAHRELGIRQTIAEFTETYERLRRGAS